MCRLVFPSFLGLFGFLCKCNYFPTDLLWHCCWICPTLV